MKKIYLAISTTENGKHFAFSETIRTGQNLLNYVKRYKTADVFHLCETATEAATTAAFWNECYKENKTYLFDT